MIDEKSIVQRTHEMQALVRDMIQKGINLDKKCLVAAIVDKLPPKWKSFVLSLKHKRDLSTMSDLIVSLQIEEKYREIDKLYIDF